MFESPFNRPVVVIVDDDASLLAALRFSFETEGFSVIAFGNAEAALARDMPPSICFIFDEKLPGLSGLDLLEHLRRRGETTPAIIITSNPKESTRRRAVEAGAHIIEKPLLNDALSAHISKFLH